MKYFLERHQIMGTLIYDVETAPLTETFEELEEKYSMLANAWLNEAEKIREYRKSLNPEKYTDQELYEEYGGLYPEFGKAIAISAGVFDYDDKEKKMKFFIKNLVSTDETKLLEAFNKYMNMLNDKKKGFILGGYNIKVFDNPFLLKRYAINRMQIPDKLNCIGKKPWEIVDLDIAELWKIGTYDKFVKLEALVGAFGVESPKEDMDGSEISKIFYGDSEDKLDRISNYCQGDVESVAEIFLILCGLSPEFETVVF